LCTAGVGRKRDAMSRLPVVPLLLVTLFESSAGAQTTLELDRIGIRQHRDYLRLQPFEQIDTQASNLIITLNDLVLPGNAGHDLRFQLTYNPDSDTGARYRTVFWQTPVSNDRNTMNGVLTSRFWRYRGDAHTLELPDGTICTYDSASLRLIQIADVYGNLVTLTWSAGALQVQQILKNEPPRTALFAMNDSTNLPSRMMFNDGTHDRVWRYAYEGDPDDSTGRLKEIAPPSGRAGGSITRISKATAA